jgi:hypothetical protein
MPAPQGFLAGLAQVFGGGLQGYALDQKNRQVDADRDEARQNALEAKRAAEEARAREDALKGIRQGTAPNQGY